MFGVHELEEHRSTEMDSARSVDSGHILFAEFLQNVLRDAFDSRVLASQAVCPVC